MPPKAETTETMDHEALVKEVLKLRADLKRLQKTVRKLVKGEDDEEKPSAGLLPVVSVHPPCHRGSWSVFRHAICTSY